MAITPKINTTRRNINGLLPEVAIMGRKPGIFKPEQAGIPFRGAALQCENTIK